MIEPKSNVTFAAAATRRGVELPSLRTLCGAHSRCGTKRCAGHLARRTADRRVRIVQWVGYGWGASSGDILLRVGQRRWTEVRSGGGKYGQLRRPLGQLRWAAPPTSLMGGPADPIGGSFDPSRPPQTPWVAPPTLWTAPPTPSFHRPHRRLRRFPLTAPTTPWVLVARSLPLIAHLPHTRVAAVSAQRRMSRRPANCSNALWNHGRRPNRRLGGRFTKRSLRMGEKARKTAPSGLR